MFHTGCEALRDAGGPVTRLAHAWMLPTFVVATSAKGAPRRAQPVATRYVDRTQPVFTEHRRLVGGSLFNVKHERGCLADGPCNPCSPGST